MVNPGLIHDFGNNSLQRKTSNKEALKIVKFWLDIYFADSRRNYPAAVCNCSLQIHILFNNFNKLLRHIVEVRNIYEVTMKLSFYLFSF